MDEIELGSRVYAVFGIDKRGLEIVTAIVNASVSETGYSIGEIEHIAGEEGLLPDREHRGSYWVAADRVHSTLAAAAEQTNRLAQEAISGLAESHSRLIDLLNELDELQTNALPWRERKGKHILTGIFVPCKLKMVVDHRDIFHWCLTVLMEDEDVWYRTNYGTAEDAKEAGYQWLVELHESISNILRME